MHRSRHHLNAFNFHLLFLVVWWCCCLSSSLPSSSPEPSAEAASCSGEEGCNDANDGVQLTCSNGLPPLGSQQVTFTLQTLVVCDLSDESFDPRALVPRFTNLLNLSLHATSNPDIDRRFSAAFPAGLSLESLNVSRLGLVELGPAGLLDQLAATLKILDVSHNKLTKLAPAIFLPLAALNISLLAGNPWQCVDSELSWVLDTPLTSRLTDLQNWTCGPDKFPGKPLLPVMQMIKTLRMQCPSRTPYNCTCELSNVVWGAAGMQEGSMMHSSSLVPEKDGVLIPVTIVNCSSRGLYRPPPYLPANTTTLLLSRNMISDVRPLANNPHYRRVLDVYLDHNQVRSIAALEGSEWLSTFRVLSLRGNQLAQLPTYALDNAFQKNRNLAQLYLGNNHWSCECMFTPGFQDLLAKYQPVIRDAADIKCAKRDGDANSQLPIRDLSRSLLCQPPGTSLTGLDVLNVALALLIVLVLGKLAYDYWSFKTSGRLPWLVAKMP